MSDLIEREHDSEDEESRTIMIYAPIAIVIVVNEDKSRSSALRKS